MRKYLKSKACLLLFSLSCSLSADNDLDKILNRITKIDSESVQIKALQGLKDGLRGIKSIKEPVGWEVLYTKYSKSTDKEMKVLLREFNLIFGSKKALKESLAILMNHKNPIMERELALKSLLTQNYLPLLPELKNLLNGEMADFAIRAYANFEAPKDAEHLLKNFSKFDAAQKSNVILTLASRKSYAKILLKALKSGDLKRHNIPSYVAPGLEAMLGKEFTDVYNEGKSASGSTKEIIAKYKAMVASKDFLSADSSRGRSVYNMTCGACHNMYGTGGVIGPELTGSNRADIDYLLLNIVDPNFDVADNYKSATITSKSGQVFVGNIVEEDDSTLTLKMIGQKQIIAKSDIAKKTISETSMMPVNMLDSLTKTQALDLIKYLQTKKQVEAK